jgi:hypothetical protein
MGIPEVSTREELLELRQHILNGEYSTALAMIDELDEMSRKATLRNIRAYLVRLLVYLIKNQHKGCLTNSWAASIRHSVLEIQELNALRQRSAFYLQPEEWEVWLDEAFDDALYAAADEVAGGRYTPFTLTTTLDRAAIITQAQQVLAETYYYDRQEMAQRLNQFLQSLPGGAEWR